LNNPSCVVCGKQITYSYDICYPCAKRYGGAYSDFPEWLKYLLRESQKERRRRSRGYYDREVPMDGERHIEEWDKDRF